MNDGTMDEAHATWLAAMVPEGAVLLGFFSVVVFLNADDGEMKVEQFSQSWRDQSEAD